MKDYTDITFLVDRSGSMSTIKEAMESGFDEFLSQHREVPSTKLTLVQFDSQNPHEVVYEARSIGEAGKLVITPRDMTPLYDALNDAVKMTGRRLRNMPASERPQRVLFIIITDGLENASTKTKASDLREVIQRQENTYNWQFIYLGANQDALLTARDIGISQLNAMTYGASIGSVGSTVRGLVSNTLNYTKSGDASSLNWSDTQRKDADPLTITPDPV